MPTSTETIPNRFLSGDELKRVLADDFARMLDNEGLLSGHIAYGRVGYEIVLKMHMANPMNPEAQSMIQSRPVATNLIASSPALAAIESAPLAAPVEDDVVSGTTLAREIDSPNSERLRLGIPVLADVRQQDGTLSQQPITYPPDESAGDGAVTIVDSSVQAKREWWGQKG